MQPDDPNRPDLTEEVMSPTPVDEEPYDTRLAKPPLDYEFDVDADPTTEVDPDQDPMVDGGAIVDDREHVGQDE